MPHALAFADAQQRFVSAFPAPALSMRIALAHARGRVLAAPLRAAFDQPPADQSAMDGYAVRHADLGAGRPLRIQQRCYAGEVPLPLGEGCATRLFTGSLLPAAADTVIMQEQAREADGHVVFDAGVRPGLHIRRQGEEFRAGQLLIAAGTCLGPLHVGLAAAQGIDALNVFPALRVGILTSGDELVPPGRIRMRHQIYDSNAPMLAGLVEGMGGVVTQALHAPDTEQAIRQALSELRARSDLVLSVGGASVGEKDRVRPALASLGAQVLLSGVAMKPGKPVSLARLDGAPVVVLPGNPGAALAVFALLVGPLMRRLQGRAEPLPAALPLPLGFAPGVDAARERFFRVRCATGPDGRPCLERLPEQGAGAVLGLARADGLARIAAGASLAPGDSAPYHDFAHWLA